MGHIISNSHRLLPSLFFPLLLAFRCSSRRDTDVGNLSSSLGQPGSGCVAHLFAPDLQRDASYRKLTWPALQMSVDTKMTNLQHLHA